MALLEAIRHLQLFRNNQPFRSKEFAKENIYRLVHDNSLSLVDGEMISIRYYADDRQQVIKTMSGIYHEIQPNPGESEVTLSGITWLEEGEQVSITASQETGNFVSVAVDPNDDSEYIIGVNTTAFQNSLVSELSFGTPVQQQDGSLLVQLKAGNNVAAEVVLPVDKFVEGGSLAYRNYRKASEEVNEENFRNYYIKSGDGVAVPEEYDPNETYFEIFYTDTPEDPERPSEDPEIVENGQAIKLNIRGVQEPLYIDIPSIQTVYGNEVDGVTGDIRNNDGALTTYLDQAITADVALGNLAAGSTIPAGYSLSQILQMLVEKEFTSVTKTDPSISATGLSNGKFSDGYVEVGVTIGNVSTQVSFTDGNFAPGSDWNTTATAKWSQYNGSNPKPAGCTATENSVTVTNNSYGVNLTNQPYGSAITFPLGTAIEGEQTFTVTGGHSASTAVLKSSKNNTITSGNISIGAGTKSKTLKVKAAKKYCAKVITESEYLAFNGNLEDMVNHLPDTWDTSTNRTTTKGKTFTLRPTEVLVVIIPDTRSFTIKNALGASTEINMLSTNTSRTVLDTPYKCKVAVKVNDGSVNTILKELVIS